MANWKYLAKESKESHELYGKKTALDLFFIFLILSVFFSFLGVMGRFMEYEERYMEINGTLFSSLPKDEFYLIGSIPIIYTIGFICLAKIFGKSKKTAVSLVVFLITLPIVGFISSSTLSQRFELFDPDIADGFVSQAFFSLIFILVFIAYGLLSKPFNLQYLGRVKEL